MKKEGIFEKEKVKNFQNGKLTLHKNHSELRRT
jgi:hypothetical protein